MLLAVAVLSGCKSTEHSDWKPTIYIADPYNGGIIRPPEVRIACSSLDFKDYVCLSKKDMIVLYRYCLEVNKPIF